MNPSSPYTVVGIFDGDYAIKDFVCWVLAGSAAGAWRKALAQEAREMRTAGKTNGSVRSFLAGATELVTFVGHHRQARS